MAVYRARWIAPATLRPVFRDFHSKREAEAFRALPRNHIVFLERCKDDPKHDHRS